MTSAGNIDKLIVQYSDKKFNADNTAMSFFSAHSDSEVNKKLRELGALQVWLHPSFINALISI